MYKNYTFDDERDFFVTERLRSLKLNEKIKYCRT
jgi:hypothetical protein